MTTTTPPRPQSHRQKDMGVVRVAAYCRQSLQRENGGEFGSIQAQRQAIEDYVRSQRESGWQLVTEVYEDQNLSGATENRPGFQLTVLSPADSVQPLSDLVFRETTTLGVRMYRAERRELDRHHVEVETEWGSVRVKVAGSGGEILNWSPEFDDCERVARVAGVPVKVVIQAASLAYAAERPAVSGRAPTEDGASFAEENSRPIEEGASNTEENAPPPEENE